MAPINTPKMQISDLGFFHIPPEITPPSPTITRDPRRPAKNNGMSEIGSLYLGVSYLDFDDCKITQSLSASTHTYMCAIRFIDPEVPSLVILTSIF